MQRKKNDSLKILYIFIKEKKMSFKSMAIIAQYEEWGVNNYG
jgi:hypothetical protein